jgi:hypothetical protein
MFIDIHDSIEIAQEAAIQAGKAIQVNLKRVSSLINPCNKGG